RLRPAGAPAFVLRARRAVAGGPSVAAGGPAPAAASPVGTMPPTAALARCWNCSFSMFHQAWASGFPSTGADPVRAGSASAADAASGPERGMAASAAAAAASGSASPVAGAPVVDAPSAGRCAAANRAAMRAGSQGIWAPSVRLSDAPIAWPNDCSAASVPRWTSSAWMVLRSMFWLSESHCSIARRSLIRLSRSSMLAPGSRAAGSAIADQVLLIMSMVSSSWPTCPNPSDARSLMPKPLATLLSSLPVLSGGGTSIDDSRSRMARVGEWLRAWRVRSDVCPLAPTRAILGGRARAGRTHERRHRDPAPHPLRVPHDRRGRPVRRLVPAELLRREVHDGARLPDHPGQSAL